METEEILGYDCDRDKINEYYLNMSGGSPRLVTQFYEVKTNLSFKQFNIFINSLDENKHTTVLDIYSKMSKK